MLQVKNIVKDYEMDKQFVHALRDVSVCFRDCEFVSILGPSGCGKTTLLNIIGGLDRYTSGDIIINGISTRFFNDEYWDAYRNSEIGFVFQSYNLIPHLSVLANVELALKLSGYSKQECRKRAIEALKKVDMDMHLRKRPHQLSGGQMQRVSIARALVNNPKIILADEPTGALDSQLGEQVMEVLKEVAKDKLIIMVTHNDDLAVRYSTRIIKIKDGAVVDDSDPFIPEEPYRAGKDILETSKFMYPEQRNSKKKIRLPKLSKKPKEGIPFHKTKMKVKTALGISMRNLWSKKSRTSLTAIAGSIGIIGMGLVLSVSNGINHFMDDMKSDMLATVPIGVYEYSMDYNVMIDMFMKFSTGSGVSGEFPDVDEAYVSASATNSSLIADIMAELCDSIKSNDLSPEFVEYLSKLDPDTYSSLHEYYGTQMNLIVKNEVEGKTVYRDVTPTYTYTSLTTIGGNVLGNSSLESKYWNQLIDKEYMEKYYDVLYGKYPTKKDEIVLIVNEDNNISKEALESLGYSIDYDSVGQSFEDICKHTIQLVSNDKYYKNVSGTDTGWSAYADAKTGTDAYQTQLKTLYEEDDNITLKVVGVLRIKQDAPMALVQCNFCYTPELAEYVRDAAYESAIAVSQRNLLAEDSGLNVFSQAMAENYENKEGTNWLSVVLSLVLGGKELNGFNRLIGADNTPVYINIFAADYEGKEKIVAYLDAWNEGADGVNTKGGFVKYFDITEMFFYNVETLTGLATMSLILVAAVSLLVSSIMIAIITSNSVVERTREIGILRSIGAKKQDVLSVFLAETSLIGALSGIIGVVFTYAFAPVLSSIIENVSGFKGLAVVSPYASVGLFCLSIVLACIAGFIPSMVAAHKNVVDALRSD